MKRADYAPQRTPQLPGTSHLSIVDDCGQVVSMTTTIEFAFGSEMMAKGFFLNNELTDFSLRADARRQAGRQRAGARQAADERHVAHHRVQTQRQFWIAAGSPGGPVIIPYVANR